ncbi:hypothetical protein Prudu_1121S000100 [Prunus dulcis]|uniref:Bulb-type lectin domain-containing protein n=1 Tax=Prunus dulcis TaxID=3755 RepID=A0A5H2XS81_PRUDU|nr:hypothetical protein Prudu_1121S000100 [Prunus dulcis]
MEVYNITSSQPLAEGQTLVSPGHIFELGFFSPNNSANKYAGIWHKTIFPRKVVWVANIEKALSVTDTLASLTINSNGNLELVDGKQSSIWSTNISVSSNGSAALLLDSGNFVVQDDIGAQLWRSFDYPVDTLLPMMLLGFDNKSGKRDVLTAWKSESDGSTGLFSVGLAPQIPTQMDKPSSPVAAFSNWASSVPIIILIITMPSNTSAAMLLDSGKFVVKVSIGAADQLWQSFDYPSDTLLPSMRLGFDSKSGKRNVLTAWKSESDPSTGCS